MSNLLLEFTKKDETELYQDQDIFTISYEIELDTYDPDVWSQFRENSNLDIDDIPESIVTEMIDITFQKQPVKSFYDYIEVSPSIGDAFIKWVNESGIDSYGIMIRVANGLGLLGDNIDEDLLEDLVKKTLGSVADHLVSSEAGAAKIALAKNIMSNRNLKDYIEDQLEISLPDPDQIDMFGEDSKLEAIGNLILKTIPDKDERTQFFDKIFFNSFEEVGEEKRNYAVNYVDYLRNYTEEIDRLGPASIDQTEEEQEKIENLNDIYDLILDNAVIEEIFKQIPQEINNNADNPISINEFESYNMYADGMPADIESDFEEWIQSEFRIFRQKSENNISDDISENPENYFNPDDYPGAYDGHDREEIIKAVEEYFPNFYEKWGDILTFTLDGSIRYGFEMFPTTYLTSINKAFKFLEDFYEDYENQNTFEFNRNTGLHTNIGIVKSDPDSWNYFKGFLFLNDNFATRGFEERLRSGWSNSIRDVILNKIKSDSSYVDKTYFKRAVIGAVESNFDAIESAMNSELKKLKRSKEFGFNIQDNRIEFRYPGGDLDIESLKDATLYYAYIVKLITDPQFKKREYLKKATAFVLGMGDDLEQVELRDKNFKSVNRAFLILKNAIESNPNPEPLFKISKSARIEGITPQYSEVYKFLNPNIVSNLSIADYMGGTGHYEYSYVAVNSLDRDSKTIDITVYFIDNSKEEFFLVNGYGASKYPAKIKFINEENKYIPMYNFIQAITSKQIVPATTEEYAKIKLFSDPDKSIKYLERSIPWMKNALKIKEILEDAGIKDRYSFSLADLDYILFSGDFDNLKSLIDKF